MIYTTLDLSYFYLSSITTNVSSHREGRLYSSPSVVMKCVYVRTRVCVCVCGPAHITWIEDRILICLLHSHCHMSRLKPTFVNFKMYNMGQYDAIFSVELWHKVYVLYCNTGWNFTQSWKGNRVLHCIMGSMCWSVKGPWPTSLVPFSFIRFLSQRR